MSTPGLTVTVSECRYVAYPTDGCPTQNEDTADEFCGWITQAIIPVKYNAGRCGDVGVELCHQPLGDGCVWGGTWEMGYYDCDQPFYNPCQGGPDCDPPEANIGTPFNTDTCETLPNAYVCGRYVDAVVQLTRIDREPNCIFRVYPRVNVQGSINICGCGAAPCYWNNTGFAGYATYGTYDPLADDWYVEFEARTCQAYANQLIAAVRGSYGPKVPNPTQGWIYSVGVF